MPNKKILKYMRSQLKQRITFTDTR